MGLAEEEYDIAHKSTRDSVARKGRSTRPHVLVVEVDEDSRDMMRQLLEHHGFRVGEAASAEVALERLSGADINVVITDVSLGGTRHDGVWLLRRVRSTGDRRLVPVIAVTGYKEREHELRRLDFAAVLIKPIAVERLAALVHRLVSGC